MIAALISRTSPSLRFTTYSAGSSSFPSHTIGPVTGRGSLSGELRIDEVSLRRLSEEDLVLRGGDNMVVRDSSEETRVFFGQDKLCVGVVQCCMIGTERLAEVSVRM